MRRTCVSRPAGVFERPACRRVHQLGIGHRAPQEERQARRQIEVADAIGLAGAQRRPAPARGGRRSAGWRASPAARAGCPTRNRPCLRPSPIEAHADRRNRRRARRRDRPASRVASRISVAHAASSAGVVGRQVKMRRRLGVSETPVTCVGPVTANSRRCGSAVTPNVSPMLVSASVCSIGATRSSTGPSARWMNAADTRCGPALT